MKVLFLGGDKRQLEIINHLADEGHEVDVVGFAKANFAVPVNKRTLDKIKICKYNVIMFPVSGVGDDFSVATDFDDKKVVLYPDMLMDVNDRVLIFTGIKTKSLDLMLTYAGKDVIALMEDEEVKRQNSIPTVEGIIADLVENTDRTIDGSKIFILGYGHVGKELTKKLRALGAYLTVGVLEVDEFKAITESNLNISCVYTTDKKVMQSVIHSCDAIVNTVPNLIMNEDYLRVMNKSAYLLDISSHPHGVDFKAANELQIKNKLYMGIPAKVAPKTSGQILVNKIESILERSK